MADDIITQVRFAIAGAENPRFPKRRLRNRLRHYGLRGDALELELARIMAGPQAASAGDGGGTLLSAYPYGWRKPQMTRLMKRIFCGFGGAKEFVVVLDDFGYYVDNDHR